MPNNFYALDVTADGTVPIPVPQDAGGVQLSASGSAGGGTLTVECSFGESNDWVPAGRDAADSQLTVPGTRLVQTSPQFQYRLKMAGSVGAAVTVRWGIVHL